MRHLLHSAHASIRCGQMSTVHVGLFIRVLKTKVFVGPTLSGA